MRTLRRVLVFVPLAVWAACSTTHVTQAWRDPKFEGPAPKKVLVVAMVPDSASRRTLEEEVSAGLKNQGSTAIPSAKYFAQQKDISREAIRQVAEREKFDAVLVARFRGVETRTEFVPGNDYGDMFGGRDPWYDPGFTYRQEKAHVETSLFNVGENGRLIWAVTTATVNPNDSRKQTQQLAAKIVGQMKKDKLL